MMLMGPKLRARLDAIEGRRRVDSLDIVTCYFNPCGYRRIRANYDHFAASLRHPVRTIELAFDDDPFVIPGAVQVRGSRERNLLWQKERLLNLIIEQTEADAVAWIDADMLFTDPDWFGKALDALYQFPAVQLFSKVWFGDADGKLATSKPGFVASRGGDGSPGGAWAARRECLPLWDVNAIGGGDSAQAAAWVGTRSPAVMRDTPMDRQWQQWARSRQIRVGCLKGDVVHLFHGTHQNRRYVERYKALDGYDPSTDIEVDGNGLLAWTDHALSSKPDMVRQVGAYFRERREDE